MSVYLLSLGAEEMSNESDKTEKLGKAEGYVDFEHVKFGYEDTDKIIIHDFQPRQNRDRRSRLSVRQVPARRHW